MVFGPSLRQPTVMNHNFSQVPRASIPRSQFDRTSSITTTFDAGYLVPIFVDEVLPGDTFNLDAHLMGRLTTPLVPFMSNLFLDTHYFAVPLRLIWNNFQKFMGEQIDPGDSTDYVIPQIVSTAGTGFANQSLFDYLGWATLVPGISASTLFNRAYNLVWNEWYRDENLQDSVVVDKGDGPDSPADYVLLKRGKRHDYFTSCLPWPQKGDAVTLPLGTRAPVLGIGKGNSDSGSFPMTNQTVRESDGTTTVYSVASSINPGAADSDYRVRGTAATNGYPDIYADLTLATAATINALREAFQIQELLERDARGGTRYTEIIRSHFGVVSPDARLQRPEYLGGGSSLINVHPIGNTSSGTVDNPQGNIAAFATVSGSRVNGGHGFVKSFVEHSIVIGLASVRADLTYQQGMNRMFFRSTRYDFYWPSFANLGEQAVLNREIYTVGTGGATDTGVFGYQERFAEYRYKPSMITGKFRSNDPQSLDNWHLSQEFGSLPVLNDEFIEEDPPMDRVLAVADEPDLRLDGYLRLKSARPMPVNSIPGSLTRF